MNQTERRLCPNEPPIASKVLDGEAILINLDTGAYYSLTGSGAVVWEAVTGHRTRTEIHDHVAAAYDREVEAIAADVDAFLDRLEGEELIRHSPENAPVAAGTEPSDAGEYRAPELEKFTDMEELLALDPPTPGALDNLMRQPLGDD